MFADPLLTIGTLATAATNSVLYTGSGSSLVSYVCTGRGPLSSTYRNTISSTHYVDLLISRQVGKRSRYTVRLTETELVADPINSELNSQKTSTIYLVADVGVLGTGSSWIQMCNALGRFVTTTDLPKLMDQVLAGAT
jgi:hypothetical protein